MLFHALPAEIRKLAVKNYLLWRSDPSHRSLEDENRLLARAAQKRAVAFETSYSDREVRERSGIAFFSKGRALGKITEDSVIWVWIGTHAEYDRLIDT
jgi:hypothetical protein